MMKRLVIVTILAAVMCWSGVVSAAVVGYWSFESNLSATIGGDATIGNGSPVPGTVGGQVGNSVYFDDAQNEYAVLPIGFGTGTGTGARLGDNFSISVWYNLQPIEGNGSSRFFVYESATGYDLSYGVRDSDSDGDKDDGQAYNQGGSPSNQVFIDAATQFEWHHVLATYASDGTDTTMTYWIDGVKMAAQTMTQTSNTIGDTAIHIGDYRTGTSDRDWDGLIDEVAVWNHALSDADALEVYSLGLNGQPIPEPTTLILLGLGGLSLLRKRRA